MSTISRIVDNSGQGFLTGTVISQEDMDLELNQLVAAHNDQEATKLNKSGGTLTGAIILAGDATVALNPVTLQQFDVHLSNVANPHSVTNTQVGLGNVTDNAQVAKDTGTLQSMIANLEIKKAGAQIIVDADTGTDGVFEMRRNGILQGRFFLGSGNDFMEIRAASVIVGLSLQSKRIISVADPTANQDASTKNYTDTADALKLNLAGGTLTGALVLDADGTIPLHPITKQQFEVHSTDTNNPHSVTNNQVGLGNVTNNAQVAKDTGTLQTMIANLVVKKAGAQIIADTDTGTDGVIDMSRNGTSQGRFFLGSGNDFIEVRSTSAIVGLSLQSKRLINLADPTSVQDAVTRNYSDTELTGHTSLTDNPHSVTKAQVSLSNVTDNLQVAKDTGTLQSMIANLEINKASARLVIDTDTGTDGDIEMRRNGVLQGCIFLGSGNDFIEIRATSLVAGLSLQSKRLVNLADPTAAQDGATRAYVLQETALVKGTQSFATGQQDTTGDTISFNVVATNLGLSTNPSTLSIAVVSELMWGTIEAVRDIATGTFVCVLTSSKSDGGDTTPVVNTFSLPDATAVGIFDPDLTIAITIVDDDTLTFDLDRTAVSDPEMTGGIIRLSVLAKTQ